MTYYELVDYLRKIKDVLVDNEIINTLNKADIKLDGNRSIRFLNHLEDTIVDRLFVSYNSVIENTNSDANMNTFMIGFKYLVEEIDFCLKLANINIIESNEKDKFIECINININIVLDKLKEHFTDNEIAIAEINKHYIKFEEKETNE